MADEPGKFLLLSKKSLYVDTTYQRTVVKSKTLEIASEWSWVAFGCVSVASRGDGSYYVLDGQHRVVASWSRSDIFGSDVLVDSARKMSYRVGKGGAAVWKDGMLNIINRGLKSKFHGRNR